MSIYKLSFPNKEVTVIIWLNHILSTTRNWYFEITIVDFVLIFIKSNQFKLYRQKKQIPIGYYKNSTNLIQAEIIYNIYFYFVIYFRKHELCYRLFWISLHFEFVITKIAAKIFPASKDKWILSKSWKRKILWVKRKIMLFTSVLYIFGKLKVKMKNMTKFQFHALKSQIHII